MARQRTGGMTAIGIMNLVFGAIGTLMSLLVAVTGGVLAAASGTMETELGAEAQGIGEVAATGGAIIAAIGLLTGIACATLFVGGIGILKLANWGRKLCIGSGAALALLTVVNFTQGGANIFGFATLAYCVTVVALCFSSTWKDACSTADEWSANTGAIESDQFRQAA